MSLATSILHAVEATGAQYAIALIAGLSLGVTVTLTACARRIRDLEERVWLQYLEIVRLISLRDRRQ